MELMKSVELNLLQTHTTYKIFSMKRKGGLKACDQDKLNQLFRL